MSGVEFTKVSSKGQVVIPQGIRERLQLREGMPLAVVAQDDMVLLKKIDIPKIKNWSSVTAPFRKAAEKSGFTEDDLLILLESVRRSNK
jgi:AbrB family looped-hinge helix DNA binding protein